MNKKILINKILFHLGSEENSFLYILHENHNFDFDKFDQLLVSIRTLKAENFSLTDIDNHFIANLLDRITYLYAVLRDVSINQYGLNNISTYEYYEHLVELSDELISLFNRDSTTNYNGEKYSKTISTEVEK